MDRQALNEIYYPLELKQAALVRALSHGGFGLESGWYNGHYHKDEAGNSTVTFSISGTYKDPVDETEENGEAQADTQTAQ